MAERIEGGRDILRLDFKEIIGLNVRLLHVFGNIAPEFASKMQAFVYYVYATAFVGFIYVAMLISEIINIIKVMGNLEKMTEASFLSLTHLVQVSKLYAIYGYRQRLKRLIASINRPEFHPKTPSQYDTLKGYIKDSKAITRMFLSACVVTCSFWTVYPFTIEGDLQLPLAGWYPFDTNESPAFEMTFMYQFVASTSNGLSNICLDTLMSGVAYVGMLTSEIVNMILVLGDIEKMTAASFLALTHLVQVMKFFYVFKYGNKLKFLIKSISRKSFQPKSFDQYIILHKYVQESKMISKSFLGAGLITCCFWGLSPFTQGGDLCLPLAGWYPFNTDYSPAFEITFVYQFVGSIANALSNISLDTLMSGLIMVVCAQLSILNDSLRNIRKYAERELPGSEMSPELQARMDGKLMECVVHHRHILEFSNEVTFLFTNSILGQFIVSVVIICITLFEITLLPWGSLKFFSLILYQFCMLLEIFLLCYYGNEVILQSMELTKFVYFSDWTDCSTKFKRNMVFFMTRSQVPLRIYAGGFFTLSLETFVKILKSSWSYFAVLNRVHSGEK